MLKNLTLPQLEAWCASIGAQPGVGLCLLVLWVLEQAIRFGAGA